MTRIDMIVCNGCKKRCNKNEKSYYELNRFDFIGEEFIENTINEFEDIDTQEAFKTIDMDDLNVHFCSLECLKKYVKGMEK